MVTERVETYVVRVYRRGPSTGLTLVGVIETPGSGWQKPFHSVEELAAILATPRGKRPGRSEYSRRKGDGDL